MRAVMVALPDGWEGRGNKVAHIETIQQRDQLKSYPCQCQDEHRDSYRRAPAPPRPQAWRLKRRAIVDVIIDESAGDMSAAARDTFVHSLMTESPADPS